jgi:hypothetical protein
MSSGAHLTPYPTGTGNKVVRVFHLIPKVRMDRTTGKGFSAEVYQNIKHCSDIERQEL